MPLLTVRLDRVFDVVHLSSGNEGAATMFSIEYGGQRHFGITLPGNVNCQDGMTVSAYLEREHDWQTLRGWRDHATGDVVYKPAVLSLMTGCAALSCIVISVLVLIVAPGISVALMLVGLTLGAAALQSRRKGAAALLLLRQSTPV
jgi:hypothetical protein